MPVATCQDLASYWSEELTAKIHQLAVGISYIRCLHFNGDMPIISITED